MKIILLLLILSSSIFVYASDGDTISSDLMEFENGKDNDIMEMFGAAYCDSWITQGFECTYERDGIFIQTDNGGYNEWYMGFVLYGSFTQSNTNEAIILMTSDSHGNYWSDFLFRKQEDWQYIDDAPTFSYEFATTGEQCLKYPHPSGRDLLLCLFNDTFVQIEGDVARYYYPELSSDMGRFDLRVLDFGSNLKETSLIAFNNHKLQNIGCSNHNIQGYMASSWRVADIDGNNNGDISLELVEVSCERVDNPEDIHYKDFRILPITHQLYWIFDGEIFTPTPETQIFLDNMR